MKRFTRFITHLIIMLGLLVSASAFSGEVKARLQDYSDIRFPVSTISGVYYSCDGAQDTMRRLLNAFDAQNVIVRASCDNIVGISDFINLTVSFSAVIPATVGTSDTISFMAEQKTVSLSSSQSDFGGGDCQFVSDFTRYVLPYLGAQVISSSLPCSPFSERFWELKADVLVK